MTIESKSKRHEEIEGTTDNSEKGLLGEDPQYLRKSELSAFEVDSALDLKQISIRLPADLIDDFKWVAKQHGLGYQPLMRQVLKRFAEAQKRRPQTP